MVLYFENRHSYAHSFDTVTLAYLNRYPNPYAKHVKSTDTLERFVDDCGRLWTTKLVVKTGRLPKFIEPFLGKALDLWIIEKLVIDPKRQTMHTYTANVDHRRFIQVEERLDYTTEHGVTTVDLKVKFSLNFTGFKQKIEQWLKNKFLSNMNNTREGLKFVMNQLNEYRGRRVTT